MKKFNRIVLFFSLVFIPAFASAHHGATHRADENALRKLVKTFVNGWNRHDASVMASVWRDDGDVINPVGRTAEGRSAVQSLLAEEHSSMLSGTRLSTVVESIDFVSHEVAVIDAKNVLKFPKSRKGYRHPDFAHHLTLVAVKEGGQWHVSHARPYAFMPSAKHGDKLCKRGDDSCAKKAKRDCHKKEGSCHKKECEGKTCYRKDAHHECKAKDKQCKENFCSRGGKQCRDGHHDGLPVR